MIAHSNLVYFAHGKESGPWGSKINRLAQIARQKGFHVESLDYTSTFNPDERVEMLLQHQPAARQNLILAGSSMGGYVSTVASERLKPQGLFLMAPAFYLPGYAVQNPAPHADHILLIHGWRDPVAPVDNALRFARQHQAPCHLLNSAHRLVDALPIIEGLFGLFLEQVLAN